MSFRGMGAALTMLGVVFGCAKAEAPPNESEGGAPPSGLLAYAHRRVIKLSPSTPTDFAIAFEIDHAALVAVGRAASDGSDVRVGYEMDGEGYEIDRILDTATSWDASRTVIWFRTQGSAEQGGTHYVYYGEDEPTEVMADPNRVFDAYEAFDGDTLADDWTVHAIGGGTGSTTVGDGVVRFSGSAGDIGGVTDSLALLGREMAGDFVLDVSLRSVSGSLGGGAKAGGLMVRQSPLEDARFTMVGLMDAPRQRLAATRVIDGEAVTEQALDADDRFPQLFSVHRSGASFTLLYSDDAITWVSLGDSQTVEMLDPVIVGFPIANLSAGSAHIEIDYLRARTIVLPTPTADLGAEEQL